MSRIEQEAARMGVLVEDLLAARAPRRGARRGARARRPRRARARRGRRRPRDRARPRRSRCDAEDDAIVLGDADQLRQVLGNLAAQRARPHAGGHAGRGRRAAPNGDARRRSRCATTAPGCRPSDGDALFERFWRAEPGAARGPARRRASAWRSSRAIVARARRRGARGERPGRRRRFTVGLPAS